MAALICEKESIVEGIKYVQDVVDGSMTMLVMTKEGIYGARDRYGRTPLVIGKKDDSYCLSFEVMLILTWAIPIIRNWDLARSSM